MEEVVPSPDDERLKVAFQREKRAFVWTCIWMGLAAILWCGIAGIALWEHSERLRLVSIPGDARFGAELRLSANAFWWRIALGVAALPATFCFVASMANWLLIMGGRRRGRH
jgi:hypothetical protein